MTNSSAVMLTEKPVIVLTRLPMPPSSNHQYSLFRRGGKMIHVPSKKLVDFRKDLRSWILIYRGPSLQSLREICKSWNQIKVPLSIHCHFFFKKEKLFTKNGEFKKLDVSNRIKAIHDEISNLLEIDDKCFFYISAGKSTTNHLLEESVTIKIQELEVNPHYETSQL